MKKDRITLYISKDTKKKAKIMAAQMGISVSHLIEGLIAGMSVINEPEEKN